MSATREAPKVEAILQQFAVMARTRKVFNENNAHLKKELGDLVLFSMKEDIDVTNADAMQRDLEQKLCDIFNKNTELRKALFRKDHLDYLMQLQFEEGEVNYYYTSYILMIDFVCKQFRKRATFQDAVEELKQVIQYRHENYPDDALAKSVERLLKKCIKRQADVPQYDLKELVYDTLDLVCSPDDAQIGQYRNKANSIKYTYKDQSMAGMMLTVLGMLLICGAIAAAAATFGGLAPLSVVGGVLGASLIISGLGLLGVGSLVSGAVILSKKNSLKRSIFRVAESAARDARNDMQDLPMEVVLGR